MLSRDKAIIQQQFPDFYKYACRSKVQTAQEKMLEEAQEVYSMPPQNTAIGDNFMYSPVYFRNEKPCIPFGKLHLVCGDNDDAKFLLPFHSDERFIRTEQYVLHPALIKVDNQYKIIYYEVKRFEKYQDECYAVLEYESESPFFSDLTRGTDLPYKHRKLLSGFQFLMFEQLLPNIDMTEDRYREYTEFLKSRKNA